MTPFDQTPDKPQPFGYKTLWFAFKASNPEAVVDALELKEATPANWVSGLAAAHARGGPQANDPWVFVSAPVNGWVLAASTWWAHPVAIEAHYDIGTRFDALFAPLMKRFEDVQFFGSHRVSDFVTWARALNGKPLRLFAYADGQVLANIGERTEEEAKLGLADLSGLSPSDATNKIFAIAEEPALEEERLVASGLSQSEARMRTQQVGRDPFPDETDVVALAALWSVDPTRLADQDHPVGLGLAARLPKNLAG
jgi:hypothetical protein